MEFRVTCYTEHVRLNKNYINFIVCDSHVNYIDSKPLTETLITIHEYKM